MNEQQTEVPQISARMPGSQVGLHGTGQPLGNGEANPPTSTHCPQWLRGLLLPEKIGEAYFSSNTPGMK